MKDFTHIYIVLLLFLVSFSGKAQQDPNFSMYRYNMNVINPAYAGTNGNLEALVSIRSQWAGVQDAPETYTFNINSPVGKNVGVGLSVVNDQVFVLDETHLYADFSYKIKLTEQLDLHAGIKAGGSFLNIDLNKVGIENDPLFAENVSRFNPNVGLGFYLKAERFYITLSAPNLLSNDRFEKEGVNPVSASDDQQFYLGGGYTIPFNDNFKLQPSVLGRAVSGVPLSVDITTSAWYKDRLELGVNYRLDESFTTFLTANFMNDTLSFGYAYEHTTTDIGKFNNGSHEIILKISFR
ncbi:type IX secretion system PorP/SprF family membrane protein [Aquimarina sp. MAR_2010_214]|uniref:PorP/SprF family type IX secretion system membrane protein n=1 Tax=Aquimarina sp. MAR_2010_214 TaxID=1250026 RepID=UPI000C701FEA|nr:type IX secretion system membrane protein PorP/SprF [Aquimarina sp. MAR_2010_214]PKV48297.1 type IX secretion system PorP/SprF family membrane protein [Aquimarina sp. MAR_2010_214]